MVQDAITHTFALAEKGVSRLPAGGDVTVAYLIIGENVTRPRLRSMSITATAMRRQALVDQRFMPPKRLKATGAAISRGGNARD